MSLLYGRKDKTNMFTYHAVGQGKPLPKRGKLFDQIHGN